MRVKIVRHISTGARHWMHAFDRRAAKHLSVSEPALSQQVGDLENELGLRLFDRNSRRVALTEVGRVFLGGARRTLVSAQEAVAQAHEAAAGERGRLAIGPCG